MNGSDVNGKAALQVPSGSNSIRANGEPMVKVQPPRREDLQPSYAQIIKADTEDAAQHGWYGSKTISSSNKPSEHTDILTPSSRHDLRPRLLHR